jgi:glycosyltransferase involved in cell wall biosynthesis
MLRIKIIYVIDQLGKGGTERQLYEFVKGLNQARFEPMVVSLSEGGYWGEQMRKLGVRVIELRRKRSFELARLIKLIALLKSERPEIVHTMLFASNTYGRIAARLAGVPRVIASERSHEVWKNKLYANIDRLLAPITDCVISNSVANRDYLVRRATLPPEKAVVVHNGIDASSYHDARDGASLRKEFAIGPEDCVVGMVANLIDYKNHAMLFEAMALVAAAFPRVKLLLAGDGAMRQPLQRHAERMGISRNLVLAGLRDDVPALLHLMQIFVLTSRFEGLSNAIMEAMAAGLPCVVTDVGGNRELVVEGETGFLVRLNDAPALAKKILFLLQHPDEAQAMGRRGAERIRNEFALEKMVTALERIYEKLLQQ